METLFTIIFLVSLTGLIVGLIAPRLVIVWGDKKTRGRAFLAYGSATIISLVILGLVTSSDEQGSQKQQIARQASQTPTNPYFLEWQEIDTRTKALKHDRDSMRDVWLYLAEKNEKWQVVGDKEMIKAALPKNLWVKMTSEIILVLRYFVWVIAINFWGLCPQTPGVYRFSTNPEEVKRWQQ